jgi:hypothetical protein
MRAFAFGKLCGQWQPRRTRIFLLALRQRSSYP